MTLWAVTSADLSWEISAIIYPAEIHRAKLMQFFPRKKDVASSTYFQLKQNDLMGRENSHVKNIHSELKGAYFEIQ